MSDQWVPETRFGVWFQGTWMWTDYVLRPAVEDLITRVPEKHFGRILDVGCGDGASFGMLAQWLQADQIVAVEIDPELVSRARERGQRCPLQVEVQHGSAQKLELPDASIDLLFCHQTVHHLSDPVAALHEFHRVLRPGGLLLLSESCRRFLRSLAVRLLFRHPRHTHKTAEDYADLVRACGFEIRSISHPDPFWSRPDKGLFEQLGVPVSATRVPTLVNLVAVRPDCSVREREAAPLRGCAPAAPAGAGAR